MIEEKQIELENLILEYLKDNDLQFILHSNRDEKYIKIIIEKNLLPQADGKGFVPYRTF